MKLKEICKSLEEFLASSASYYRLDFTDNETQIGNEGAIALADKLKHNRVQISQVTIPISTEIDRENALNTAKYIKHHNDKPIISIENEKLVVSFYQHPPLISVKLSDNQIGDEGAAALADSLNGNNTLIHLDLRNNRIGDKGAAALAESLNGNNTLIHLDLSNNRIGDEGAEDFDESLNGNNILNYLDLGNKGAEDFDESLNGNKTLHQLDLSYSQIENKKVAALDESINDKKNTYLPLPG